MAKNQLITQVKLPYGPNDIRLLLRPALSIYVSIFSYLITCNIILYFFGFIISKLVVYLSLWNILDFESFQTWIKLTHVYLYMLIAIFFQSATFYELSLDRRYSDMIYLEKKMVESKNKCYLGCFMVITIPVCLFFIYALFINDSSINFESNYNNYILGVSNFLKYSNFHKFIDIYKLIIFYIIPFWYIVAFILFFRTGIFRFILIPICHHIWNVYTI